MKKRPSRCRSESSRLINRSCALISCPSSYSWDKSESQPPQPPAVNTEVRSDRRDSFCVLFWPHAIAASDWAHTFSYAAVKDLPADLRRHAEEGKAQRQTSDSSKALRDQAPLVFTTLDFEITEQRAAAITALCLGFTAKMRKETKNACERVFDRLGRLLPLHAKFAEGYQPTNSDTPAEWLVEMRPDAGVVGRPKMSELESSALKLYTQEGRSYKTLRHDFKKGRAKAPGGGGENKESSERPDNRATSTDPPEAKTAGIGKAKAKFSKELSRLDSIMNTVESENMELRRSYLWRGIPETDAPIVEQLKTMQLNQENLGKAFVQVTGHLTEYMKATRNVIQASGEVAQAGQSDLLKSLGDTLKPATAELKCQTGALNAMASLLDTCAPGELKAFLKRQDFVSEVASAHEAAQALCDRTQQAQRCREFMQKHGCNPTVFMPIPNDFEFPAKTRDEIKSVMYSTHLKKYYLHMLNLEALTLPEAVEQMCVKMVGNFNALTKALYFSR